MKYEDMKEQYNTDKYGYEFVGTCHMLAKEPKACMMCEDMTRSIDIFSEGYICSEECQHKFDSCCNETLGNCANEFMTDVPESWRDRCSGDGYTRYKDEDNSLRYTDNNEKVNDMPFRPCAKCGQYPTEDSDDFCLQHLGNVINACCGHGNKKGYIQFDNGVIIRGFFKIERD